MKPYIDLGAIQERCCCTYLTCEKLHRCTFCSGWFMPDCFYRKHDDSHRPRRDSWCIACKTTKDVMARKAHAEALAIIDRGSPERNYLLKLEQDGIWQYGRDAAWPRRLGDHRRDGDWTIVAVAYGYIDMEKYTKRRCDHAARNGEIAVVKGHREWFTGEIPDRILKFYKRYEAPFIG